MNKTTQLKKLLLQRKALPCPGVYDALSARMVEYCGFQACQISGFGVSASSLGMTDYLFGGNRPDHIQYCAGSRYSCHDGC